MKATKQTSVFGTALLAAVLFGAMLPGAAFAKSPQQMKVIDKAVIGQVVIVDEALIDSAKPVEPEVDDSAIVEEDTGSNSDGDQAPAAEQPGEPAVQDSNPPISVVTTSVVTHEETPTITQTSTPIPSRNTTQPPPPRRRLPHTGGNDLGFLLLGGAAIVFGGVVLLTKPKDDAH